MRPRYSGARSPSALRWRTSLGRCASTGRASALRSETRRRLFGRCWTVTSKAWRATSPRRSPSRRPGPSPSGCCTERPSSGAMVRTRGGCLLVQGALACGDEAEPGRREMDEASTSSIEITTRICSPPEWSGGSGRWTPGERLRTSMASISTGCSLPWRGRIGKTVRIRCGAAAVIGEAPEPREPLRLAEASFVARRGKAVRGPLAAESQKTGLPRNCSVAPATSMQAGIDPHARAIAAAEPPEQSSFCPTRQKGRA